MVTEVDCFEANVINAYVLFGAGNFAAKKMRPIVSDLPHSSGRFSIRLLTVAKET
jgi:hypothetical protein